jgi:ABC-type sugar transport system ATPase subunit
MIAFAGSNAGDDQADNCDPEPAPHGEADTARSDSDKAGAGPGDVAVGVRPNGFEVSARAGDDGVAGVLVRQEYLGSESFLEVRLNNRALVVVQEHLDHGWKMNQELRLPLRAGNLHLFNS